MSTFNIKRVASLEELDREEGREVVGVVNWAAYPYRPDVSFNMGYTQSHLYIKFFVREQHIKAEYLNNHDAVCKDSCVELFMKLPSQSRYFNFEVNCIGTGLAAHRHSKADTQRLTADQMSRLIRVASLPHARIDKRDNTDEWSLLMGIPFEVIGCSEPPTKILANIYKCGDETVEPHYLSWAPIISATPNFHLPEFFSEIELKHSNVIQEDNYHDDGADILQQED